MADEEIENENSENLAEEETVETPKDGEEEGAEEAPKLPDDPEELKKLNAKLYARAKTAEGFVLKDGKWIKKPKAEPKPKPKPDEEQPNSQAAASNDPVKTAKLANALRGLDDEEVDFAQTIADGSKTTLLEALQTNGFKAFHKEKEAARKKARAKLAASQGSGQEDGEPIVKSGMTRDEHMAVAKQHMG